MVRARVFLDHKDLFIHGLQLNTDLSACPLILAVCHARGIKHFLTGNGAVRLRIFIAVINDIADPGLNDRLGALVAPSRLPPRKLRIAFSSLCVT